MSKPPKVVIPGLNRGAGMLPGFAVGRRRGKGRGPAELLDINQLRGQGLQLASASNQQTSSAVSSGVSSVDSLSTSSSTSLSQISSSLSGAISSTSSLSNAVSTVDSNQNTSISQISSSLSGFVPAYPVQTTGPFVTETFSSRVRQIKADQLLIQNDQGGLSLSCDSGSGNIVLNNAANTGGAFIGYFSVNGRMFMDQWGIQTGFEFTATPYVNTNKIFHEGNLSFGSGLVYDAGTGVLTASGGGAAAFTGLTDVPASYIGQAAKVVRVNAGETGLEFAAGSVDPGQSTSLSQISSSLSGAISSTTSLSSAVSTVDSNQSTSISTNLSKITSLSTTVSTVDSNQSTSLSQISSSLSGAISSTSSLSTAVSTVVSGSISAANSRIDSLSTAGGGGGTAYEKSGTLPVASSFTLTGGGTGTTLANSSLGVVILSPSSAGDILQMAKDNTALVATTFSITARLRPTLLRQDSNCYQGCLILRNSSNGRLIVFGDYVGGVQVLIQTWGSFSPGSFAGNILGPTSADCGGMPWRRIICTAGALSFQASPDGDIWTEIASSTLAAYLTAAGGSCDQGGFGVRGLGGTVCYSWALTT